MLKGRGRDTRTVTPPSPGHLAARPPAIITKAPSQVQRRPRPEPDYEVVEFPSEQYVNAKLQPPPPPPPRPSAGHPADAGASCGLCGGGGARVRCSECGRRALCASCDDMYHRHPKRRHHQRQALTPSQLRDERPPLPPKSTPPVPPPRRHKLTGDRSSASPRPPALDQRRATLGHLSTTPHTPSAQALNHNNHSQRHPIPPHLQGKLPPASPTHLGSMPYLPAMQHAVAPVAQAPQMQSNTMGHLAAWGRQRGSLQGFHVPPNMVMPTEPWESPESVPAQSPPWARPMRRGASVLDLGAGCAGCAGPWRYGSCASLDHQWAWGAPCCLPPHPPPQHLHPHAHMHTPQAYRRADSRAASRVGSRAGSRAASPAVSVRSRASRRNKHRSPSPPPLPSSDADSESDSDSDNHVPLKHDRIRDLKQGPRRDERSGDLKDHRRDERSIDLKDHRRDERRVDLKEHRRDERSGDLKDHRRDERSVDLKDHRRDERSNDLKDHRREERRSDVDVKYDHSKEDGSGESREKEEDTLGPAPPPPSASWQCEHCTFVNEPGVRVCAVCCRTPTTAPMVLADVCARMARVSLASEPSPARVGEDSRTKQNGEASRQRPVKERASTGCGPSPPREDKSMKPINRLVTPTREPDQTRTESRMRHDMGVGPSPPRDSQGIRNTMAVGPSSPPRDNHENHSMGVCLPPIRDNHEKHSMGVGPSPPRDDHERHSMGVGPSPPKEITVRSSPYRESKTPQRHSVSVGPSPPRDGTLRPATNNQIIVHKTTGTSPPRETLVESRSSTSNRANVSNTGTSPPPQSISTQTYDVPNSWEREPSASRSRPRRRFRDESRRERSHSRHSLSSDTRESERSVRTSGGGGGSGRWEWRGARDSSPCDWSEGERRRASSRLTRRASHLDLRRPHRRTSCYPDQAASPELLSSSRTLSLEALAGGSAGARREAERGLELAQLMTDAERLGFSAAEVHAALAQSPAAPLAWLQARWASLCAGVRAAAARLAPAAPVTELEARAALARHRGAMWPAVTDCVERHRRQTEVVSVGPEGRLRGRVWGSPGGADDDAAPPARRQPRAEDSSDEFEAPTPTKYRDDDWMYLPLEPPVDPSPDVWSEPRYEAKDDRTEDIAQRLKSFLVQAGVPTIDENLLLKGLLADNAVFKAGRENGDFNDKFRSNKPQSVDLVQSEIDFIDAYNALTRLSPLPNINNAMADALAAREINQSLNFTQERHNDLQKIVDISNPFLETMNKQINSVNGSLLQTVQNSQQDSEIIPDTIINEVHAELNTPKLQQSIIKRDYPPNANTVGTDLNLVSQNWNNANSEPVFVTLYNPLNNDARFVTETQLVISQNTITPKFVSNTQAERKDLTVVESQGDSSNNRVPADVQNMPKSQLAKRNTKKAGNHDVLSSNNTSPEPTLQKSVHKPRANSFKNSTKTSPKLENSKQEEEKSNNLSDIVDNTQKLIQQMKAEINSDINSLDGRSMSQSETENSSNESDLSTEHESSYSDTEEETDDLTSEANETTGTEEENNNHSEKSGTIINRTSSEENEQFEEAMDHIEEQNKSFKETNIEILDSIARSLQEEHTISLEINNTTEVNNHVTKANIHITESERSRTPELRLKTQQDFNNNSFAAVNSFEEIYDQLNSNNSKDTANELNSKQTKSQNFKENTAKSQTPKITLEKQDILVKLFKPNSPTRLLIVDKYKPVLNAVVDEIIEEPLTIIHHSDENNHVVEESVIVATFVENSYIEGNTEVPIVIKNSTTEDNGIYQDLHANSKLDTNINYVHDSTVENQIIQGEDVNATHSDIPRNSESPLIGNSEHIIVDTPLSNRIDISSNTNLDKNENNAKAKSKSPEKYNSIIKSNIPKLIKVLPNNKQKGEKTPPKVIASKVPVRRSSLKQYPAPDPPKSHFGNIQSGHVKQLQTRLFNSKTAKAQSPPTTVEATATTSSTLNKKRHAPLPPPKLENKQPSPPKVSPPKEKKSQYFRETCRTEDEWTESDSEDARLQIGKSSEEEPQRAPSPPPPITLRRVSGQLIDLARVRLLEGSPERQARMLLADGAIENWEQAQLAVELVSRGADPPAALLAALECADLTGALAYLHQDCELCASRVPEHEMVSMLRCTHRCCRECARHYFTVQITERSIADCVCPYCKEPELETLSEDEWLEYFAHLDILLKTLLDIGLHELFQRKLRDRTLARDPNFRWCVECSSGFFVHPKHKKLRCPECKSVSCATCRKPWSSNHEGLSCEQYATWLEDNDPERSLAAVQQHLRENGLECPRCHFKYSLSRGGCMHFTCTQCKYEFCYGCGKPFMMGARCGLSEYCNKLGLHAHHPRNCLFYLRDKEPHELQTLLQMNNVTFETEAADGSTNRCPVLLQRETPTGLVDGACGGDVPPKHAGLCKPHYVEYLAGLARALDPIPIMEVSELVAELRRRALPLPERGPWDTDPIYAGMCAEIVKEKIPLD